MTIIWGYSANEELPKIKELGKEITEAKQVFSALLFKEGIKGLVIRIESILEETEAILQLIIDGEICLSENLLPAEPGDFTFEMKEVMFPETKIEAVVKIIKGCIQLPTSSIGNGMGFQKKDDNFQPTKHLGLGLIIK